MLKIFCFKIFETYNKIRKNTKQNNYLIVFIKKKFDQNKLNNFIMKFQLKYKRL